LQELLGKLGLPARDVIRWKEPLARSLGITREMSDDELIPVLVYNPDLLQRPIVVRGERAILARPFQEVETLL
jgi:arsenate reductase